MVTMAQSSPGNRSACALQSKTITVMLGWHAMVHGNRLTDVDRLQAQADTVAAELAQRYRLADD
jgi:hypothetical protein